MQLSNLTVIVYHTLGLGARSGRAARALALAGHAAAAGAPRLRHLTRE
jgi:hypothetical protein